jgi:hypothetical protein
MKRYPLTPTPQFIVQLKMIDFQPFDINKIVLLFFFLENLHLLYKEKKNQISVSILQGDFLASQEKESLFIFIKGVIDDLLRKVNASMLVKTNRLEIITQELLVKAFLCTTGFVLGGGPKAG